MFIHFMFRWLMKCWMYQCRMSSSAPCTFFSFFLTKTFFIFFYYVLNLRLLVEENRAVRHFSAAQNNFRHTCGSGSGLAATIPRQSSRTQTFMITSLYTTRVTQQKTDQEFYNWFTLRSWLLFPKTENSIRLCLLAFLNGTSATVQSYLWAYGSYPFKKMF